MHDHAYTCDDKKSDDKKSDDLVSTEGVMFVAEVCNNCILCLEDIWNRFQFAIFSKHNILEFIIIIILCMCVVVIRQCSSYNKSCRARGHQHLKVKHQHRPSQKLSRVPRTSG